MGILQGKFVASSHWRIYIFEVHFINGFEEKSNECIKIGDWAIFVLERKLYYLENWLEISSLDVVVLK